MTPLRRGFLLALLILSALVSGCATKIRSEVTSFHQWPDNMSGRSFSFVHQDDEAKSLERQSYENLLRTELLKLGLVEQTTGAVAQLAVRLDYRITGRDVRVIETVLVDPWYGTPWYGPGFYNPYWGWHGYGPPYYGPMWPSMPVAREQSRRYSIFQRELRIRISDYASEKTWFEVTAKSEGEQGNLAIVMPYLVQAAFKEFPGTTGVPRVIDIPFKK
ncbi:MAG: DUF4136 domain-containing protein [Oxalobacteraceae bacterium]|nr:DUF4136 domain-containing protein [Oxalobacteraceae bacterium]